MSRLDYHRCVSLFVLLFVLSTFLNSLRGDEWSTYYEKSGELETPRYDETMAYCERLAKASPYAQMRSFGTSPEGRGIYMIIISKEKTFSPTAVKSSGKPIVMIQSCIHPGESEGKDASLRLMRDFIVFQRQPNILQEIVLIFIPIFNVDGHEQFSAYNRINQNGPKEMGWRVTATRLNLNRDFMKADTPEMRALLELFNQWMPHLFIDCHTTNGADYQYELTYQIDVHEDFGGAVSVWARDQFIPHIISICEKQGHVIGPFAGLIERHHPEKGMRGGIWPPRLSNPYMTLRNRAGLLIETHSLKPYNIRVSVTYDFILAALEELSVHPERLLEAVKTEEKRCIQLGSQFNPEKQFGLQYKITDQGDSIIYRGYKFMERDGPISGEKYPVYEGSALDVPTIYYNNVAPSILISPPSGYLIPQAWQKIIQVIKLHGIQTYRLSEDITDEFETYRFSHPKWRETPYEGRHPVSFKTHPVVERMTFRAGSIYVPLAQAGAKVILHLLEPQAPDALIFWGFFDTIFEQKEYFETYVMEPLAQKMAEEDPDLMQEFERKLAGDSGFAADPYQRLKFFYERSPYWDKQKDLYPVARVTRPLGVKLIEESK